MTKEELKMIIQEFEANKKVNKSVSFSKFLAIFSCVIVVLIFGDFFYINHQLLNKKIDFFDFTVFSYAIPSSCALCGATFAFYYNKAKLENAVKIKFSYVEKLLQLKKELRLYTNEELQMQLDNQICMGEGSIDNSLGMAETEAEQDINISIN